MQEEIIEDIEINVSEQSESRHEVTLTDVLVRLWLKKYWLVIWIALGVAFGIVYALGKPKQYTATLTMMPETNGSKKSSTSAALQALGMGGEIATDDAYNPSVYPDIVSSIPFITGLFDVEVQTSRSDTTYTLSQYVADHTESAWWTPRKDDNSEEFSKAADEIIDPFMLTASENSLYHYLNKRIVTDLDRKTSQISISVTLQDPLVAAQLTDTVAARLQEYITDYRTAKARTDLDYAIEINEEAQRQYYEAQQAYAEYMDRNQGLALYSAQTTRDRLENEMKLAFNLYNQTSERVQSCEAKVQEATPVFAVVQPATVPLYPSAPKKGMIVGVSTFVFGCIGILVICCPLFISGAFRQRLEAQRQELASRRSNRGSSLRGLFARRRKKEEDNDNMDDGDNDFGGQQVTAERSDDSYSIE